MPTDTGKDPSPSSHALGGGETTAPASMKGIAVWSGRTRIQVGGRKVKTQLCQTRAADLV